MINRVRGTQDQLDLTSQNWIIDKIKTYLRLYNFIEIETPIIESVDLFKRSVGEQTDVVNKELYVLEQKSDETVCLRPEGTAGVTRAYLQNWSDQMPTPWKTFFFGPFFRYERPQKGRWRQFDQFNIEIIKAADHMHDIELLLMLDRLFRQVFEIFDFTLKINYLPAPIKRQEFRNAFVNFLAQHASELCTTCAVRLTTNPLRCLDCKNQTCQQIYQNAPQILDYLDQQDREIWHKITSCLQLCSVNFVIDSQLVRGLDYYQGIVFEFASSALGSQDSLCGGGRYELASKIGSKQEVPSLGVGIGIGRLEMVLSAYNQIKAQPDHLVCAILPTDTNYLINALHLADSLRTENIKCQIFETEKLKKMLSRAANLQAKFVIIIGEDEVNNNYFTFKNLTTGEQQKVQPTNIITLIKEQIT